MDDEPYGHAAFEEWIALMRLRFVAFGILVRGFTMEVTERIAALAHMCGSHAQRNTNGESGDVVAAEMEHAGPRARRDVHRAQCGSVDAPASRHMARRGAAVAQDVRATEPAAAISPVDGGARAGTAGVLSEARARSACTRREPVTAAIASAVLVISPAAGAESPPHWSVHGFAEFYYGVDSNDASANRRPDALYNHTRTDAPQLNLGLLQFAMSARQLRGNLGFMVGSYGEENLALEPDWAKNIWEANVGLALSTTHDVWLDIGMMPSHIGFESAISSRNPTLTRSLAAENSPYYLTGARVSGRAGRHWTLAALVVTGWQRTAMIEGNSLPSVGTQVAYAPSKALSFNWSTFVGTDDPDRSRRMRYFNNLYALYAPSEKLDLTLGLDVGVQQVAPDADDYDVWYTPQFVARYALGGSWMSAARLEYYADPHGVIVGAASGRGTRVWGLSCNLDRRLGEHVLARVEARYLQDAEQNFARDERGFSTRSTSLLVSLAVEF